MHPLRTAGGGVAGSGKDGRTGARLASAEFQTLAAFRYALRRFLAFSEAAANAGGLLPQQYQALLAVKGAANGHAMTIAQLAEQLIIKHNSAVGLVDRMAVEGLVTREASTADHRKVLIRLAPKGTRLLERLAATHRAELRRMAPELKRLIAFLSEPVGAESGAGSGKPVPVSRKVEAGSRGSVRRGVRAGPRTAAR